MNEFDVALKLLLGKLKSWGAFIVEMTPNFFLAAIIIIFTFYVAGILQRGIEKVSTRFKHNAAINNLVSTLLYLSFLLIGFLLALSILKLDKVVFSLLAGVGILGLALGFAFQDIAANFIAGVVIAVQKPFRVGDMIQTNDYDGVIERISLRTIDVRQTTGELVKVPNKLVFEKPVTNLSYYQARRVDLPVGISYSEDLERVQGIVKEALEDVKNRIKTREVEVMYDEFGDSSIVFKARFWITYKRQVDYVGAKSDAIIRIKKAFDQNNIVIPFPIRTLDIAAEEGEKLSEKLEALRASVKEGTQGTQGKE